MINRLVTTAALPAILIFGITDHVVGQTEIAQDELAIRKTTDLFVKAFNEGDAKAVAALWTENGQLVLDAETTIEGRDAIAAEYNAFLKENPDATISVSISSIRQLGPALLIEKGTSRISQNGDESSMLDEYTLVHVKKEGKWLIATANAVQKVQPIDWRTQVEFLTGTWKAERGDWRMEATVKWTKNKSFLRRAFTVTDSDKEVRSGHQVIGWDAGVGQITSWTFAADGGHARGYWSGEDDRWTEQVEGTTAAGELFRSTNVFTRLDDDELLWQSVERSIEGYALDDTPQVRIVRLKK